MSSIAPAEAWLAGHFAPVSLEVLNRKADMLTRLDNKYIVSGATLRAAAPLLAEEFDILQIGASSAFDYATCYFDTPDLRCFFDHHRGRRKRVKLRMRSYCGTDLCFLEVKLKDKRGVTVKRRLPQDPARFGRLDGAGMDYLRQSYHDQYGDEFDGPMSRVLDMRYRRMTLVARSGGERMTIDCDLRFRVQDAMLSVGGDRFIVETKSANGNGLADRILRRLHQHPAARASKYCMGMALTGAEVRFNRFLPALRRLGPVSRELIERKAA